MQINVTRFFNEAAPKDYSASVAEIGANAGLYTWQAACDDANDWNMLDDDDKRQAFREFVKGYGAWSDEEINAWTNTELNALFIQWVSSAIRECLEWPVDDVWTNYEELAEAGKVSSNLWKDEVGQVWFDLYD